jgi:tripartite-type tricarboxylate transporter receptor subunit TctC
MIRRRWLFGAGIAALGAPRLARAAFPERPIRMVAPWPPGSSVDLAGRALAQEMTRSLGQSVIVENRGGASGTIGSAAVARSRPDGHTLVLGNATTHGTVKVSFPDLPYDPLTDFDAISAIHKNIISVSVHRSLPVTSFAELIGYARENPGRLSFGTAGVATPHQLLGEMLNRRAGINLVHVPYRGGGPVVSALVGGEIPVGIVSLASLGPLHQSGAIRILAVGDARRYPAFPDVPAVSESFPGLVINGWAGLYGPAGLPLEVIAALNAATRQALATREVVAVLEANGLVPDPSSPEHLRTMTQNEIAAWEQLKREGVQLG